jgi:hypothetical protein
MILQVLSDCTINGPFGFRMCGPGELLTLPVHHAVRVVSREPNHFRILKPTPLLPGVEVCWLMDDDRVQGPGRVELIDGNKPNCRVAVLYEGALCWIHERNVFDINPWPLLDAKLEEQLALFFHEGPESPKLLDITEWVLTHFDENGLVG